LIAELPEVVEITVLDIPHEFQSEAPKVFIVAGTGARLTPEAVNAYCRKRLLPFKIPEYDTNAPENYLVTCFTRLSHERGSVVAFHEAN
jgi:hypothetical protein